MSISIMVGVAAAIATFIGGLFALKFKDKLHLILGFSAGAVIAVAFFEIIPEAIELASYKYNIVSITTVMGIGFLAYLILDRMIVLHSHNEERHLELEEKGIKARGAFGAGTLSIHSFLDGLAIGIAFQVSTEIGLVVTTAVLAHDFSDGINTANLILKNGGDRRKTLFWVMVDSLAPLLGVISTLFFNLESTTLGLILALFAGDFIYIGASDLLPESHHRHPKKMTTFMTVAGMLVIFIIVKTIG